MGLLDVLGLPRLPRANETADSLKLTPSTATATGQPVRRNDPPIAAKGPTPPTTVPPAVTPTAPKSGTAPPINNRGGTTAPTQEQIAYEAERRAVQGLADALRGHKQA